MYIHNNTGERDGVFIDYSALRHTDYTLYPCRQPFTLNTIGAHHPDHLLEFQQVLHFLNHHSCLYFSLVLSQQASARLTCSHRVSFPTLKIAIINQRLFRMIAKGNWEHDFLVSNDHHHLQKKLVVSARERIRR